MTGPSIIIASYSYHNTTDLGAVKQVLEQPTNNFSPGQHYNFISGDVEWHLIPDSQHLVYVLICNTKYPLRCAHACLEELQRTFQEKAGDRAATAKERSLDRPCSSFMQALCAKYNDVQQVDKLAGLAHKVNSVKLVMQENVDAALQNCVKLDHIERQAEELHQAAGIFNDSSRRLRNKLWWKNMKMNLIIGGSVLVIIIVIVAVAVTLSQGK